MVEIIPAILAATYKEIEKKTALVAGLVPLVQVDICDGTFVNSRTWPYTGSHHHIKNNHMPLPLADDVHFRKIIGKSHNLPHWQKLKYEIDLMVAHPAPVLIDEWVTAGVSRILLHLESASPGEIGTIIRHVRERFTGTSSEKEFELGLAVGVQTSTRLLLAYLEDITLLQFMGIERIGYQHQEFAGERVFEKIRAFHGAHPEITISVDGGVTLKNAKALVEAGASRLVCGSAIFGADDPSAVIAEFRKIV